MWGYAKKKRGKSKFGAPRYHACAGNENKAPIEISYWTRKEYASIRVAKAALERALRAAGLPFKWQTPYVCNYCGTTKNPEKKLKAPQRLKCRRCKKTGFKAVEL